MESQTVPALTLETVVPAGTYPKAELTSIPTCTALAWPPNCREPVVGVVVAVAATYVDGEKESVSPLMSAVKYFERVMVPALILET